MDWSEKEIEYVIAHFEQPELLTEEEFIEWLSRNDHRELFELIQRQREAYFRKEDRGNFKVETEYGRFAQKIAVQKGVRYRKVCLIAACMVLSIGLPALLFLKKTAPEQSQLSHSYTGRRSAELILADGHSIRLENNVVEVQEQNGVWITNDSNCMLAYGQHSSLLSDTLQLVYNTLKIPAGADYIVNLSDGTRVHLNCESEFRFPVAFAGNERRVYLDGEAFFEVEKVTDWPFIVETDRMDVRVTGTRFNVMSYRKDSLIATTLVSGRVQVLPGQDAGEAIDLAPSQQYRLDKSTGESVVQQVEVRLYTGWTDGMFVFKNQRLEDVMRMLARWYSMEIRYRQESVKDLRLSANLGRYEHVDTLLQVIELVNKIKIERRENVVFLDWK